ncbi:MAG: MBL fold metallo-hydrolase [Haliscomenobacter sp.]|nr:MBL fold metallo-hydrolase [Haliscomenobacter sp.]MBK8655922.1 MBL fold metallo-hydrolase [Haliscomenobacter sp.]MBP9075537.1 MBL fold metallo-hydrolase [Haliscomenobacter sp.]MBP9873457.1 MBL fold metallo-hydrolase [Haliscomenobacter sp.]
MENRRTFIQKSAFAAGILALPNYKWLSALLNAAPGQLEPLRGNTGFYTESGGTIGWYIHEEAIVVVDSQFPEQAKHLIERIREKSQRRIDLLINTHHHGDHTGGNIAFKGIVDKVVAHANSKKNQETVAVARKTEAQQLYPDTTFDQTWSQKIGPETVTATYFGPGHTNGDAVIHFENANVAHMGDLMFNRRFPFIDKTAGASIENWIEALQQIRKHYDKDTLFIFGHAGEKYPVTGTKDDLAAMQNYLSKMFAYVKKAVKEGVAEKDLLAKTKLIPGAEAWTGQGIERSISAAYLELKK